jgi:hypothetical protein
VLAGRGSYYAGDAAALASTDAESRKFGHAVGEADSRPSVASGLVSLFEETERRQRLEGTMNCLNGQSNLRSERG